MTSKRTIGIIAFDGVLTSEIIAPAEVFGIARKESWFADWEVLMIGVEDQPTVTTAEGITLGVACTIANAPELNVLIVPGAHSMNTLFTNEALNQFIKSHEETAQWISSNCSGAFLLANAGVLDGSQATTWFGGEEKLQAQFPQVQVVFDRPVVVDNRRLTSNGNLISYQAALVLLGKLTSIEHAHEVYEGLYIDRFNSWSEIASQIAEAEAVK